MRLYSAGTRWSMPTIWRERSGLSTKIASPTTTKFMIAVITNTICQLPVAPLSTFAKGTRNADAPLAVDTLFDLEAERARDEWRVAAKKQIEWFGPVAATEFEHIAEAAGCHQRGDRPRALEQRIDHQRRAVLEEIGCTEFHARLGHAGE